MEEPIVVEGNVTDVLPGTMFRVKLDNQHQVLGHISGKMRKRFIRLTVGDRVKMEMSPLRSGQGSHRLPVQIRTLSLESCYNGYEL